MKRKSYRKALPWPKNLWADCYQKDDPTVPEDWQDALDILMGQLSKTDQAVLYAWFRDQKTRAQIRAELGTSINPSTVVKRFCSKNRFSPENDIFHHGPAKQAMRDTIIELLQENTDIRYDESLDISLDILIHHSIAQVTDIVKELSEISVTGDENFKQIDNMLTRIGIQSIQSRREEFEEEYKQTYPAEYIFTTASPTVQATARACIINTIKNSLTEDFDANDLNDALVFPDDNDVLAVLIGTGDIGALIQNSVRHLLETCDTPEEITETNNNNQEETL